ncbi:hypothetical protein [Paenibacillus macquariensis]|uniref:Uncharacterized protein n=1 Tax=Paenibacillus macquariensis TaxID=948756 RepID=A0ABY1JXH3_9BACL|nr:hypothetical protein [Paenibacillus macquariensis]MEC0089328.1 hypothetical protein [Paenibacillus macquariensis]OAB33270.1 hypothetical protein PMSM_14755 [Paenibacillus macquariensis subsp. macquariensis]SIQ93733.1 hypothetical protein SAMN05421578_105130 [Paenibacillus macquariensis]
MGAKNAVIAGDYERSKFLVSKGKLIIAIGWKGNVTISKDTVESWEEMSEEHTKSAASAIGRGLVGSLILGPVGLLAGLSAKNKGTHVVAIQFKDGKRSLFELDDKLHKVLVTSMF